jgi:hypothetical protein
MASKWSNRYELKPGRWVFEPSPGALDAGRRIKAAVEGVWTPPKYYFHLRAGGHVAALQSHIHRKSFLHLDISDFFGSVNRSRLTRCLKTRFGYAPARNMADTSTVRHPADWKKFILPYGFVQSPILASLALCESRLGAKLSALAKTKGIDVSVYVDDIIISGDDDTQLGEILLDIKQVADLCGLPLNDDKQEGPAPAVTAFNVELANATLQIAATRFSAMSAAFQATSSAYRRAGIRGYVASVNAAQAARL